MSSYGVLVSLKGVERLPAMLQAGDRARVLLKLPPVPYFRGCWLDCRGEVVRVEEKGGTHMIGLRVSRHRLRPATRDEDDLVAT